MAQNGLSGKDCCEFEVSFLAPLFYSLPAMRCGGIISSAAPLHALHVVIRPHGYTYAVGMLRAQSSISCLFGGLRGGETKSSAASLRALPVVIRPNEYLYALICCEPKARSFVCCCAQRGGGILSSAALSALPMWLFGHMSFLMPLACCETKARSSPIVVDCAAEEL